MFGRKKKKGQAQPSSESLPPTGTPPLNNANPQKTKKTPKKDKKKDVNRSAESPTITPKKKGFRFGRKSKVPTTPYSDASSLANDSIGDNSSLYQSEGSSAKLNNTQGSNATPSQSGNVRSPSYGAPRTPSSSVMTGSVSSSYQENQSSISRGYEEREVEFWDEADVLQWLGEQGLDYFVELFEGCEIDGEYLLDVTDEDLVDLDVDDAVLRRRFLEAVKAAHKKQASNAFPTLDQQLSALGQNDGALRTNSAKQVNISEASTVPASDLKDSPRNTSPPPKLVLRKPSSPDNDSDSEFDFDSDDMGGPLDDLPDNSNRRRDPGDDSSSPRSPVAKSAAPQSRSKKLESPRDPPDEAGSLRSTTNRVEPPGSSSKLSAPQRSHADVPDSPGKHPKRLPDLERSNAEIDIPTSPTEKMPGSNPQSPVRHLDRRSGATRSRSQSVVTKWSEKDVIAWLQEAQLTHLKSHFIENKVTGTQLLNIDMQLLDAMGITSQEDRELLLAKLYELNNPTANVPEKDLISALNNTSGYEHRKHLAAMKVLQSSDSEEVQLLPPETLMLPDSFSGSSRTASTASDQGKGEEKKKKGGLSKLKGVISPKRRESRDFNLIQVWTDILRSGVTTVALRLTETEDAQALIGLCLDQLGLIEDRRLYCILDSAGPLTDRKDKGFERVMEDSECPVLVQQDWPERTPRHFELRQRPAQGGSIKVVLRLSDVKPKGKLLAISLSTPAREVIPLGLLKFGLKEADAKKYCLLEVNKSGDLNHVDGDSFPLQLDSHAFVLCDSSDMDSQLGLYEEEEATAEDRKRTDSLTSKASSRVSFSGVSLGSSAGSDLLASLRFDDDKLSKLEEEMATIEESLGQGKVETKGAIRTSAPDANSPRQVTSPLPQASQTTSKDPKDKDAIIQALRQENKMLQENTKQLSVVQKALRQLEQTYKQNETDSKQRVKEKRDVFLAESGESLPKAATDCQSQLKQVGEEMSNKKLNILKIQQQQKQLQGRTADSLDGDIQLVELEYRVAAEESAMLSLQQQQAQLLSKLEVALVDHQAALEKNKMSEHSQALFSSLEAKKCYSFLVVHRSRDKDRFDLTLSAFQSGRGAIVQSGSPDNSLRVGDRLLAVNGDSVINTPLSDIKNILGGMAEAEMVVMREADETQVSVARQEMNRLTGQLDETKKENDKLREELKRLKGLESQAKQATHLQMALQQLKMQLSDSETRVEELEQQQTDGNKDHIMRQMQEDKHKLQMEVIKLKENVCQLEDTLDEKTNELSVVCQERDSVIEELMNKEEDKTLSSHHLINEALEEGLPLWEALKSASKTEILEVLRDELEEAGRQKEYLDQLYTLMLERAPGLLEDLEEDFDASELSNNEEFC